MGWFFCDLQSHPRSSEEKTKNKVKGHQQLIATREKKLQESTTSATNK